VDLRISYCKSARRLQKATMDGYRNETARKIITTASEIFAFKLRLLRRRRDVLGADDSSKVVLPQRTDELGHRDGVGVVPDQAHHEHAVLTQVVFDELDGPAPVLVAIQTIHQAQVLLDVAVPVDAERHAQRPRQQRRGGHSRHERHPEPHEQEDLLVEQVDRQDALDRIALHVAESSNLEVAHGHAREALRGGPVVASRQRAYHVDAVQMETLAEKGVQHEQLADHVGNVKQLDEQVQRHQVVATTTTTHEADSARQAVLHTYRATGLDLALALQISAASQITVITFPQRTNFDS